MTKKTTKTKTTSTKIRRAKIQDCEDRIAEIISDYSAHGYYWDEIGPLVDAAIAECGFTTKELQTLAANLATRISEDEGWTVEDARNLKTIFAGRKIKFTVSV